MRTDIDELVLLAAGRLEVYVTYINPSSSYVISSYHSYKHPTYISHTCDHDVAEHTPSASNFDHDTTPYPPTVLREYYNARSGVLYPTCQN